MEFVEKDVPVWPMFSIFEDLAHKIKVLVFFMSFGRGAVLCNGRPGGCARSAFRGDCHGVI